MELYGALPHRGRLKLTGGVIRSACRPVTVEMFSLRFVSTVQKLVRIPVTVDVVLYVYFHGAFLRFVVLSFTFSMFSDVICDNEYWSVFNAFLFDPAQSLACKQERKRKVAPPA